MAKKTNLKTWVLISVVFVAVLPGLVRAAGTYDGGDGGVRVDRDFGKMPLYFIENQGQLDKEVGFYVQGSDKTLYFTAQGVTFALAGKKAESEETQRWVVKLDFVGANPDVRPIGEDRQEAVISYFKGKREDWKTGLPTYRRIVYPEIWDGIDLVYSGSVNKLKYEFVVKPGADTKQIRLAYRGAGNVTVKETGELMVETPVGGFADAAPYAYQEMDGRRAAVSMASTLEEESSEGIFEYGFDIGPYERTRPLILDPAVLIYCGYIGGTDTDMGYGIAVDASGSAYVTGFTTSTEADGFPVDVGPDLTHNDNYDLFVAKVNADGTGLVYCGYIGGTHWDTGRGIAVDGAGNAYVTGETHSTQASFPVVVGPDLNHNGYSDAFVAKVKADGTALVYCGYIGGTSEEHGYGIAVDASGNAYVTGDTKSSEASFPVVVGPDLTFNGSGMFDTDTFVAKVKADGTVLDYCGYIGGTGSESGRGIAVDADGNAYVTGWTESTEPNFPVVVGPDLSHHDGGDAFVAKVKAVPTEGDDPLLYCGYIGGTLSDEGWSIAVDDSGNAYVTGFTLSTEATFPVVVGPDLTYNGSGFRDAFVAKVKAVPTEGDDPLIYCGYIGGDNRDLGLGIAVDTAGNAYVTGETRSAEASFPVAIGPDITYNGDGLDTDAFVAKVNVSGTSLIYCGYIGGADSDKGYGIAVDDSGCAYATGYTNSSEADGFPVVVGPDLTYNDTIHRDAFVAKIPAWPCPTADFDDDCDVDFVDFSVLGLTWLLEEQEAGYDPNCDISIPADNLINEKDIKIFTDNWLFGK